MYCKYCGKEISEDSRFCNYCGKALQEVGEKGEKEYEQWKINTIYCLYI